MQFIRNIIFHLSQFLICFSSKYFFENSYSHFGHITRYRRLLFSVSLIFYFLTGS
jgi:hypothetical protein